MTAGKGEKKRAEARFALRLRAYFVVVLPPALELGLLLDGLEVEPLLEVDGLELMPLEVEPAEPLFSFFSSAFHSE